MKFSALAATATAVILSAFVSGQAQADLYVGTFNATIERYTPDGVGSQFANTGSNTPIGLAFDASGNLYVTESGYNDITMQRTGTIERFSPDGVGSQFANTGLSYAGNLAFDASGNLYVTEESSYNDSTRRYIETIERFTPDGVESQFATIGLGYSSGLALDSRGNLYVGEINYEGDNNNVIERYTPDGLGSLFASNLGGTPYSFAFDASDNLYVGEQTYNDGRIERYTPDGVGSLFANTGGVGSQFVPIVAYKPYGLAFDASSNLYVAEYSFNSNYISQNAIERFTPDGVGSLFANTGEVFELGLAFSGPSPVPEPASLAVLALGLVSLGLVRRKRA